MAKDIEIQFISGLETNRTSITPVIGEPLWTTDNKEFWIGDGSTAGGIGVSMDGHTHSVYPLKASAETISGVWTHSARIDLTASTELRMGTSSAGTLFHNDSHQYFDVGVGQLYIRDSANDLRFSFNVNTSGGFLNQYGTGTAGTDNTVQTRWYDTAATQQGYVGVAVGNSNDIYLHSTLGDTIVRGNSTDGQVRLRYANTDKLVTTDAGGTLTGTWNATTDLTVGGTSVSLDGHTHSIYPLKAGNESITGAWNFSAQVDVSTTGSQIRFYDTNGTDTSDYGILELNSDSVNLYVYDSSAATWSRGASVNVVTGVNTLYHYTAEKLATTNTGINVTGSIDIDTDVALNTDDDAYLDVHCDDATYGGIRLYYNASSLGGSIRSSASNIGLLTGSNEWGVRCAENGASELYYNGVSTLATADDGLNVTGAIETTEGIGTQVTNGGVILSPGGAQFFSGTNALTGAIKIAMPTAAHGGSDMIQFTVRVFDYAVNQSFDVDIAGYLYQTTGSNEWVNNTATIRSSNPVGRAFTVRFGGDGTRNCIWIGETDSTWNYLQISVINFVGGYSCDLDNYLSGWDITLETSFDTVDGNADDVLDKTTELLPVAGSLQASDGSLPLVGNAVGDTNTSYLKFMDSANSIRHGYVGCGSGSSRKVFVCSDNNSVNLQYAAVTKLETKTDGVHVTGDVEADTFNDAAISSSAGNNTIVKRHSSGYIYANYFNGSSSATNPGASTMGGAFIGTNGTDTFMRSYTPAAVRARLGIIPSGTVMLFYQSAAPTGWTKLTTVSGGAVRIVTGTGGATGGSQDIALSHTHSVGSHTHTQSSFTLAATNIPIHTHTQTAHQNTATLTYYSGAGTQYSLCMRNPSNPSSGTYGDSTPTHTHTAGGSSSFNTGGRSFKYSNVLLCSKDA